MTPRDRHIASQRTRLRRRVIAVALVAIAGALIAILAVVNSLYRIKLAEHTDALIEVLYENDGGFPETETGASSGTERRIDGSFQLTEETPFETRYFIVHFREGAEVGGENGGVETDADGDANADASIDASSVDTGHIASVDRTEAERIAQEVLERNRDAGYQGQYRFHVYRDAQDGTGCVIAVDCFVQLQNAANMTTISLAVVGACVAIAAALMVPLSRRIVDPYIENLERQRRFVTDASHELKTPIAIITANTDLIEATQGASQWTQSTRTQAARLSKLTGELIDLARADEPGRQQTFTACDLSALVLRVVEDFQPLAEARGRSLATNVPDGITVRGNAEQLERLVDVLVENAVKYCDEDGTVEVQLEARRRGAELCVRNPCAELEDDAVDHLFERFYRADSSRARTTGGYGIGLSIAESITERHGGKIRAVKTGSALEIRVTLPR